MARGVEEEKGRDEERERKKKTRGRRVEGWEIVIIR